MIQPLFNSIDDEWVALVGKYIINMGGLEAATRLLISIVERSDSAPAMNADLPSRIGYLRRRFPREPRERHSLAMKTFEGAARHVAFRNVVAHSPIMISGHADGSRTVHGILNVIASDAPQAGKLISLADLRIHVDESAALTEELFDMQSIFRA